MPSISQKGVSRCFVRCYLKSFFWGQAPRLPLSLTILIEKDYSGTCSSSLASSPSSPRVWLVMCRKIFPMQKIYRGLKKVEKHCASKSFQRRAPICLKWRLLLNLALSHGTFSRRGGYSVICGMTCCCQYLVYRRKWE